MALYRQKLEIVNAVVYDNTVTVAQARAFLAGTQWDLSDLSFDPVTKIITATVGPGETIQIPLGSVIVKHASGSVNAMTPADFAKQWEAI